MNRFTILYRRFLPHALAAIAFGSYAVIFASYHNQLGTGIASLATIPVVVAGWYFGVGGGITTAFLTIVLSGSLQSSAGQPVIALLIEPGNILRAISLILVALVTGRLSHLMKNRDEAIRRLEQYENQRRSHTHFLELLNGITSKALEADGLQSTLEILTEHITRLFNADDGFFAFWDPERKVPIPTAAYGSMRDAYPNIHFEPGELTLTASVMEAGMPIPVPDVKNSPYISLRIAALFPSRSMLGVPLIAQGRKLGGLLLGYNEFRQFEEDEIANVAMMAEQFALVLSKSLLLEEERKQVRQLTALHDVALTSIEADHEDQLIDGVTKIIGNNLFPDNFGVLLLDGRDGMLHTHPSYHFYSNGNEVMKEIPITKGVTGEVARTGSPRRIGDIRLASQYVDLDVRTQSELCVPIKFKEQVLGVINAESTRINAFTVEDERLMVTLAGQLATAMEQLRKARAERHWLDQLARSNDLIYSLAHITTHIESAMSSDEIIRVLGRELKGINLTCVLAVYDASRKLFSFKYTSMDSGALDDLEDRVGVPLDTHIFTVEQVNPMPDTGGFSQPAVVSNPENEVRLLFADERNESLTAILGRMGINSGTKLLRLPLLYEENLIGILWMWGENLTEFDLPVLSIFSKQIGTSLERARLFQEVRDLSITDPLTGLHNRRSLFELGRIEFSRGQLLNRPFCCMMLDIDHFKQINDQHGHAAGDGILHEFAQICRRSVREIDLVGRYGGEEIIIFLPETELATALHVAERLRASVADTAMNTDGREINITVSIGVSARDENTPGVETLIARADQAMYMAKHRGRNRVALSK